MTKGRVYEASYVICKRMFDDSDDNKVEMQ